MTIETRPVEAPVKTVGDVLRHAALIIEERGWIQNTYANGGVCLVGAIAPAVEGGGKDWYETTCDIRGDALYPFFQQVLRAAGFEDEASATNWNDEPGRSAAEVTAALRAAAEEADRV